MFIPKESLLILSLLLEFHSTPFGGHFGVKATIARLAATFYWPGMKADVKRFISKCSICQYNKYDPHSRYGFLQPLPLPEHVWEDISMDFIMHLLNSADKAIKWVVVGRLVSMPVSLLYPWIFRRRHKIIASMAHHGPMLVIGIASSSMPFAGIISPPRHHLGLQQFVPPLNRQSNESPQSMSRDIPPLFRQ